METLTSDSSYSSVAPGGTSPALPGTCSVGRSVRPLSPKPSSGGTVTRRCPPAFIVRSASSTPGHMPPLSGRLPYLRGKGGKSGQARGW